MFIQPSASEVAAVVREGMRVADIHFARGEASKVGAIGSARMKEMFEGEETLLLSPAGVSSEVTASVVATP